MQLTISSTQLSFGTQGDDVARLHQALRALGRTIPLSEVSPPIMGAGTVAVVRAVQQDLGIAATGVVDAATVTAINKKLRNLPSESHVVRGSVVDGNGNPVAGVTVSAFRQGPAGETGLASALTNADGDYVVSYTAVLPSGAPVGPIDLRLQVSRIPISTLPLPPVILETTPSSKTILTDAGPLEVVNFVLGSTAATPKTEYEQMVSDLAPLLGTRTLASLVEDDTHHDISLLAAQSGYSTTQIAALVKANQLTADAAVPPQVVYALVRQGLPGSVRALQAAHPDVRLRAVQAAVDLGQAPSAIDGKNLQDFLPGLAPASAAPLQGLLGLVLPNNADQDKLVALYAANNQDPDTFWRQVAADSVLGAHAADLKLTTQIAALTNNHEPLVKAVKALPPVKQASDLVKVTEEQWKALIQTSGVGVHPDTPGATPDEKIANYVRTIVAQVEAAFPTGFFAERLPASQGAVKTFLQKAAVAQAPYDLLSTYPTQYFKQNPAAANGLNAQSQQQLLGFQRMYRLTRNTNDTLALAAKVHSSQQIVRMDRDAFANQFKDSIPSDRARQVYDRAQQSYATALALFGENGAGLNRTAMAVLPKLDTAKQAQLAQNSIPDWQTLFGGFDFCACEECGSAHGPAAYFVDVLSFLAQRPGKGGKSVQQALFERRPDLGDIELSCENTNTPVPTIDLVNEILENAVIPPAPFAPLVLPAALEADLNQPALTNNLAAAFQPPLQPGGKVEIVETAKRWRIWDEAFAYSVVKANNTLTVTARSRQTAGPAAERLTTPQYRNRAAYAELGHAVFPWSLPFDLAAGEVTVFLTHLGVSRRDLLTALRPPDLVSRAAEGLGISDAERRILIGNLQGDFFGGATLAQLANVQTMLDVSGLGFADFDSLMRTSFINLTGATSIAAKVGAPVDTCDPASLQITGLDANILSRLHRFDRLRRALGWSVVETDKALHALTPNPAVPTITNDVLVHLDDLRDVSAQLRLTVIETLSLWGPLDTAEPNSLYRSLFFNPAIFPPQDDAFRLRADGTELADPSQLIAAHSAPIQAAFRLDAASLAALAAKTDGKLTLANLSLIYRHAVLARQLGLSVPDLLTLLDLTGLNPFLAAVSQNALRFIEVVNAVQSSGFIVPQLDYMIRHRANPPAPFVPLDSSIGEVLTGLRTDLAKVVAATDAAAQKQQRSAVIDRISAASDLPADVTAALVAGTAGFSGVKHTGKTALQRFAELSAINPTTPLTRATAKAQFETLEKLLKIAAIIHTLELPGSQLAWLFVENPWLAAAPDPPVQPPPLAGWESLIRLPQLRIANQLTDGAIEAILAAITGVAQAAGPAKQIAGKQNLFDTLTKWLNWTPGDLAALLGQPGNVADTGLLHANLPADYRVGLIVRLSRAIALTRRAGATVAQANSWCEPQVSDDNAKSVRGVVKAKYDEATWQTIARPLQNALRDGQREALVSYLVARPAKWNFGLQRADAKNLFDTFLIDVEMSSCQLTSRMKQAMGSVQLFAQRCRMGLEPGIDTTTDPKWEQWDWMKNFRVWEANREIWLYPENWIEPDLRTNKTPFFKDLENELTQSDLDNSAAEQALRHYLEKLDAVSQLEIVGTFQDDDNVVHVFGRTFNTPRAYYYRCRKGENRSWTPWEKLDLDITGDHLIPVMWERKLLLIWPVFTQKQEQAPVTIPGAGENLKPGDPYWEIQLAWSELQYGRWSGKYLSDVATLRAWQGEDNILFGERIPAPVVAMARIKNGGPGDGTVPDPGGGGGTPPTNPPPPASARPRQLVPVDKISFKAQVRGDTLTVVGYLRRDYGTLRGVDGPRIACPFGGFQFSGCRKIVNPVTLGQIAFQPFSLAPTGTRFDHMWFSGTNTGLTMFDGTFPAPGPIVVGGIRPLTNDFESITGNPGPLTANKHDIPVLGVSPPQNRILAPHQDAQFVGNRPFFFQDNTRAFVVTSTGTSGTFTPPGRDWVAGDLGAVSRANFFPAPIPPPLESRGVLPLPVLARGIGGERVLTTMPQVATQVPYTQVTLISKFWTTREYTFETFSHPYLCEMQSALNAGGTWALMSLDQQSRQELQAFDGYAPSARAVQPFPLDDIDFQTGGAYEIYNWEVFFHIPLMIATRLTQNQRFEDAQRWFHYIFDPTGRPGGAVPQRFWNFKPFHDRSASDYESQSVKAIEVLAASGAPKDLKVAVDEWRNNPFDPHAVARLRTTAYQKTVVTKYIDNLIAWGDRLFRANTLETINEATLLYVLAAEVLGPRPPVIQRNLKPPVQTFNTLLPGILGNALEQIELVAPAGPDVPPPADSQAPDLPSDKVLYFCIPENDKLLGYWDTVADRLFKIRHCMNIEGQVQHLPLFEPPIDPALLVRARAAGLSIGDVLQDTDVTLANYRFTVMAQKANEVVMEVRTFGTELLSVMEKNDVEQLATLRSGQELRLLQAIRDVRAKQVDEATANLKALQQSQAIAQARKDYYEGRQFISPTEQKSQSQLGLSIDFMIASAAAREAATVLQALGIIKVGSPTTAGVENGPGWWGFATATAALGVETTASAYSTKSQSSGRMAEYGRRKDEWDHQANLATIELKMIEQQIAAADIRLAMAQQELRNHDQQVEDARNVDQFLRGKFTNQNLYQYLIGRVSGVYFQSYQLAYDLAKRAELCMQHELGLEYRSTSIVKFGYWDSLKKGLLAGDLLSHDLKRLEVAFIDGNLREHEMTRHVSLLAIAPEQLLALKEAGACEVDIPEWLFDLDTPGHFMRRLKMVSVTIPCVTGPYTTIHCKLVLKKSSYRKVDSGDAYERSANDTRFIDDRRILDAIVTSSGQNDAGLFEPLMRDERYLPFEGAGAISSWRLELPVEFQTFDYGTISDVLLHLRYTSRSSDALRDKAVAALKKQLTNVTAKPLLRFVSIRHEFPTEWRRFSISQSTSTTPAAVTVDIDVSRFPYFVQGKKIKTESAKVFGRTGSTSPSQFAVAPGVAPPADLTQSEFTGLSGPGPWTIATNANPADVVDVFVLLTYTAS